MKKHKVGIRFALALLGGLLVGGVLGFGAAVGRDALGAGFIAAQRFLQQNALWALLLCALAALSVAWAQYAAGRRHAAAALAGDGEENEAAFERADRCYAAAMSAVGILNVASFTLYGVGMSGFSSVVALEQGAGRLLALTAVFMALVFGCIYLQSRFVRATKELYPEKRGSVLDSRFQKQWYDSCDEAEQRQVGEASYRALQAEGRAILLLFVVLMILGLVLDLGMTPVLVLGTLWMVQAVSYQRAARQTGQDKRG
ncbi:DUF3169 family protein [Anaerofilum sp. BX8]|uniref:DUF3169 family protein n=1 Tax=Anaerofilum hominis TaxID=2763016 RepID=A0A923ICW6_9FIRM|nr:DUF3169 family protein [Anaerofilum hominis]MBC5580695.1 DUF3169 family protein [Anaerofilum hominis]